MTKKGGAIALCSMAAMHWSASAAEVPIPDDTVADRIRQELTATGIRAGAFKVYPSVALDVTGDDNIFADSDNTVADTVRIVTPALAVRSDWSRHALEVGASARLGRYADNVTENFDDIEAYASGRVTISRDSGLTLSVRLGSLHEDRFSPDDRDGLAPTTFDRSAFAVGFTRESGRIVLQLDASFGQIDYDDVASLSGSINHDDRDRHAGEVSFEVGYVLSPTTTISVRGGYASVNYDSRVDDNGFARSSEGSQIALGAEFDLSALTSLEAYLGVARRDFDDRRLDDIQALWFGGKLIHRVSGLTTLSAYASRSFKETTFDAASGYVATRYGAGVDHELLRNLVLKLHVYAQDEDYEGIDRRDDVVNALVGAHYMINRNFDVHFNVQLRDRDVDERFGNDDYRANTVQLTVVGKR